MRKGTQRKVLRLNAEAIQRYLQRQNMTVTDLAAQAKLSRPWLSTLLSGAVEPGPEARSKLMEATGLSWDELFVGGEKELARR